MNRRKNQRTKEPKNEEQKFIRSYVHTFMGFTLVEVLVVTAITAVMFTLGAGVFLANNRFYESQTNRVSVLRATRQAADRIEEYGRSAAAVLSAWTYDSVNYSSASTTVIFRLPALNVSNDIIPLVYDHVIFDKNNTYDNKLEMFIDADALSKRKDSAFLLTDKLAGVSFTYDNADFALVDSVIFDLTVTKNLGRYPASDHVYGRATLRN